MALPRPPINEYTHTTLASGISDVDTTVSVADASGLVAPCYLVIDRTQSDLVTKNATSVWEYIKVTNISSNDLTVTRGVNGSTAQAHSTGAVVQAVVTSAHFEEWHTALATEHADAGGHIMSTATISTHLHIASGASIGGYNLCPTFVMSGNWSGPTTMYLGVRAPHSFRVSFLSVTTRTVASTATIDFVMWSFSAPGVGSGQNVRLAPGGTYASISTSFVFNQGHLIVPSIYNVGPGGHVTDFTLQAG